MSAFFVYMLATLSEIQFFCIFEELGKTNIGKRVFQQT